MAELCPEDARIFRITHIDNVPWILDHGLHCKNSDVKDPNFIPIGIANLIDKRSSQTVPIGMKGVLSDYVPFYFAQKSVMMLNIKTGYNGVARRRNGEIVVLVSSLHKLREVGTRFVFTNGHAVLRETDYFEEMSDLHRIDWNLLKSGDFSRDPEDPGKMGRYQAEALAHLKIPAEALIGIACHDTLARERVETTVGERDLTIPVKVLPSWYF